MYQVLLDLEEGHLVSGLLVVVESAGTAPGPGYGGSGTEDAGPFAGGGAGVGLRYW